MKWDDKLPVIRDAAGKKSTKEIALLIGTTVPNLHKICHRNKISLPRDPNSYKGGGRKPSRNKINDAVDVLIKAGYRVYAPDPFSKKAS